MQHRTPSTVRRGLIAVVTIALAVAACGDDDATDPAAVDSCEGLAGAGVDLLQDTIDIIDGLDNDALAAFGEGTDVPPEFEEIEARGEELNARADELGCSDEEMQALLADRIGDLSSDSVFGQFILEGIRSGESGFFE